MLPGEALQCNVSPGNIMASDSDIIDIPVSHGYNAVV
jgi:hypothetical protein